MSRAQVESTKRQDCEGHSIQQDIKKKFQILKFELETGFKTGLPAEIKKDLLRIQHKNDDLAIEVLETNSRTADGTYRSIQKLLSHLNDFIQMIPKLAQNVPKIQDQYVLPLANLDTNTKNWKCSVSQKEKKHIVTISEEIERLNTSLYSLQALSAQKYLSHQLELQSLLHQLDNEDYTKVSALFSQQAPAIIHSLQLDVEKFLPVFQLSSSFISTSML